MIVIPILMIVTAIAVVWTMVKFQKAYVGLMDLLPPQFQDGLNSKFAFGEYVLRRSTPLPLQADYVSSQISSCVAALGVSLLCFLYEKNLPASIALAVFFGFTVLTVKSWKTYQSNCRRQRFMTMGGSAE